MSIVIFGDSFTFPDGNASTNRVHTYTKGFTENGEIVHVICFRSDYNSVNESIINGVHFYYPFGQTKRSKYFLIRRWKKLLKYFKTIILIQRINKKEKINTIMVYTMLLLTHLFAWGLSIILKSKLLKECSEHPLRIYQKGALRKKQGLIKNYIESRLCDGILCISQFLVEFYEGSGISSAKLFLIPSTVDPSRFIKNKQSPLPYQYLGYFGGLTIKRDNIGLLIRAFSMIIKKHPEIHLVLGGFRSDNDEKQILDIIQNLKISSKVELLKYLPRNEIISYITHAKILVMVRGNDMESQASFPSKLTEYLCTSIPLVTENVGEISNYLYDNLNAFLVEPGNCEQLAEKFDYVLKNYSFAIQVALKGKELTNTVFNYSYQAKRINQFIETL